jgi:ABC-2 type transport system permease protein
MRRVAALLAKELAELQRNPGVFVPAILTGMIAVLLPFFVAIIVPTMTGEHLSESSDFQAVLELNRLVPASPALDPEAAIQAWIFQQFLILLIITPVAGAMAVAASSIVGEKQARTLEPLLATPLTTFELLTAKVLGAFVPAVGLSMASFIVYVVGAALFARSGVALSLLAARSLVITFVLGPLAALMALQIAVCASSRVNDARSAQQVGALVILPITALAIAQVMGSVVLSPAALTAIIVALVVANGILMKIGITLFQREQILTKWT